MFAKDNPDIGLIRAQELGLVINPHIKVKDKGYTLVINEAVADPTRVTIALQLFNENVKHDRDKLGLGDENKITIKDDKGNVKKTNENGARRRFELETELDDAAMTRSPGDLWEKQMLSFHFETTGGEEIHSVNPRKWNYMDSLMTSDHKVVGNGKMRWSYTFKYLPEDKPYRFVLDVYSVAEMDGSKISFRPSELTEPQTFKIINDSLELVMASLEKSQANKGTHETVISFYGKMDNEIMHEEWKAYDPTGKQYNVLAVGGPTIEKTLSEHWREGYISMGDLRAKQPYEFRIMKLDQIPEELTLVREVVDKRYKDPNWSVSLK